jgi:hypothetical protein
MMKDKLFFTILIISLLLISACGEDTNTGDMESIFSGYDGVKISLADRDLGVTTLVPDGAVFEVIAENRGPAETNVNIKTEGYDTNLFDVELPDSSNIKFESNTRPDTLSPPEFYQISVKVKEGVDDKLPNEFKFGVKVAACYNYETKYSGVLCLNGNAENNDEDQVCISQNYVSEQGGQGSPVAVRDIKYESIKKAGTEVLHRFIITFEKSEDVKIYNKQHNPCQSASVEERKNLDRITVEKVYLGTKELTLDSDCNIPEAGLWLGRENVASITCSVTETSQSENFQTPLRVEAKYYVKDSLTKNFVLKKG